MKIRIVHVCSYPTNSRKGGKLMGSFWQWLNGANGGGYEGGFDEGKKLADEHDNLTYDDYTWAIDKAKETFNGDEEFQQGFEDGYNRTSFWDWLNRK